MEAKELGRAPDMTIRVTQEIIDGAIERDSGHCVIAEAVKAHYGIAQYVSVDTQTIGFSDRGREERYHYLTPRSCQKVIVQFDRGIKPQPFSFRLRGGHTTRSGRGVKANRQTAALRRAKKTNGQNSVKPERVGGRPPPVAALSNTKRGNPGKRRAFGLRGFEY